MPGAVAKKHYFVMNQHGQSANRQGAFESAEAAREWAGKVYTNYPCWIVAAEPVGNARPLNKDGEPVKEG